MDEHDFDALFPLRPYAPDDLAQAEARHRRTAALGFALWGRNPAHLERQLLAPHPEIPSGFDLADYHTLLRYAELIARALADPKRTWLLPFARSSAVIAVGTDRFTDWEARCEIVRRAIDYLEHR